MGLLKVSVFAYDNYRKFLEDIYLQNKAVDRKFSLRFFARIAGYKSPSIFLEIIRGKRNLSSEGIARVAAALKLNAEEANFFYNLVMLSKAGDAEKRLQFTKEITKSRTYRKFHPLAESQYRFFKHWYYSAIRELVSLSGFIEDPEWIARNIVPAIKVPQVEQALADLIKLGLLTRNEQNRLVQANAVLTTPDEVSSVYISNWHKEYLKLAAESIDTIAREKRDISAVYFAFPKDRLKLIKELIHKFRKDVMEIAAQQSDQNAVFQMNIQLFPIAKSDKEKA